MSTGTNRERIEQNNTKLSEIKNKVSTLPDYKGDVKQFATVEAMQADLNAKEGDLAVVYRSEVKNATADSQFQTAIFPDTVVLDTAITDYVDVRYRAVDSSVMFDCWGQLDSSMFMMECYTESSSVRIQYESSDGITYTRTRMQGDSGNLENPVDFGTEIYYENAEMWNDAIGKFIQCGGMYFDGLYEYKINLVDTSNFRFPKLSSLTFDDSNIPSISEWYDSYYTVSNLEFLCNKIKEDFSLTEYGPWFYLDNNQQLCFITKSTTGCWQACPIYDENKNFLGIGSSDLSYKGTVTTYKITDINVGTYEKLQDYTGRAYYSTSRYYIPLKDISTLCCTYHWVSNEFSYGSTVLKNNSSSSWGDLLLDWYRRYNSYAIASSQLTLSNSNELLPGKIAYGKNGVVTGDGSIYKNLMPSNIYSMLGINSTDYYVSDSYVTDNCDINSANVISIIPDDNGKLDVIYDILDSSMISFNRDDLLNAGATSTEASKLLADNSVNYIETDNYICLVCGYTPACSKITIAKISKISGNVINVQTIDLSTESPTASQGNYTIHCWHSGDILRLAIGASGYIASSSPAKYSIRIIGIEYDLSTNTYSKFNFTQTPSTGHTNGTNMSGVATGYPLVIDDTWFIPFQTYNGSTIELRSVKIDFANKQITHINTITGGSYTHRNMSPCIPDNDLGKAYIAWTMASNTTNMYKLTSSGISKLIDNISQPGIFGVDVTNHKVYAGVGNEGNIIDTTNDTHIPYSDIEIPAYGTSSICENNIIRTNKYQYIYVFDTEHNKKEQLRILQDGINVYETVCGTYMNNYQIIHQYENGYWRYTFVPYKILNVLHKLGAYTNACSVMTTNKNTNNVNIVEECIPKYMQPIPITQEDYNIALQTANQIKGGNQL